MGNPTRSKPGQMIQMTLPGMLLAVNGQSVPKSVTTNPIAKEDGWYWHLPANKSQEYGPYPTFEVAYAALQAQIAIDETVALGRALAKKTADRQLINKQESGYKSA